MWEGCRVCGVRRGVWTVRIVLAGGQLILWEHGENGGSADPREFFPNLSDPDTRAAYDRRLALALGCPDSDQPHFGGPV